MDVRCHCIFLVLVSLLMLCYAFNLLMAFDRLLLKGLLTYLLISIAPKSTHITPILKSLHWLKINERIEYKILSLTYKVLTTAQPGYLHNLITLQPLRSTRSSFCCHSFSPANHLLLENHRSLI